MAGVPAVTALVAVLVDLYLLALDLLDDLGRHESLGEIGLARADLALVVDDEERRELERLAVRHLLDLYDVALGDFVLLSARADDCVHRYPFGVGPRSFLGAGEGYQRPPDLRRCLISRTSRTEEPR